METEPNPLRRVGSGSEMPPLALLPGWPQLALSLCGGWDFLPGSTRPGHNGVISHRGTGPSGTLAVGFPGLSCVNLYCCKALVLVFNGMETLSPASCPSVMVGQLHFALGLGQLKLIMNSAQVRKAFPRLLDLFFFLSFHFFLFYYR